MHDCLLLKLRRVAAGLRQQDLASRAGMSTTRYSAIERGEAHPSQLDLEMLDRVLPQLSVTTVEGGGAESGYPD